MCSAYQSGSPGALNAATAPGAAPQPRAFSVLRRNDSRNRGCCEKRALEAEARRYLIVAQEHTANRGSGGQRTHAQGAARGVLVDRLHGVRAPRPRITGHKFGVVTKRLWRQAVMRTVDPNDVIIEEWNDGPERLERVGADEAQRRRGRVDQVLFDEPGGRQQRTLVIDATRPNPQRALRVRAFRAKQSKRSEGLRHSTPIEQNVDRSAIRTRARLTDAFEERAHGSTIGQELKKLADWRAMHQMRAPDLLFRSRHLDRMRVSARMAYGRGAVPRPNVAAPRTNTRKKRFLKPSPSAVELTDASKHVTVQAGSRRIRMLMRQETRQVREHRFEPRA